MNRDLNSVCNCVCRNICAASSFIRNASNGLTLGSNIIEPRGKAPRPNSVGFTTGNISGSNGPRFAGGRAGVNGNAPSYVKKFGGAFDCRKFSLDIFVGFSVNGSICGTAGRDVDPCTTFRGMPARFNSRCCHVVSPRANGRTAALRHCGRLGPGRTSTA